MVAGGLKNSVFGYNFVLKEPLYWPFHAACRLYVIPRFLYLKTIITALDFFSGAFGI